MSQSGSVTVNTGGGAVVETLTGNSGGSVGPDGSFNINILGNNSTGINVVGNPGTNTLSITAFQATTSQEGTVTLATNAQAIAGTDAANAITSAALAAKLGTQINHSIALFKGSNAALISLGVAGNGQIPIGSIGADPVLNTITAGTGITVTNGAGTITIAADGSHVLETLTGNSGGAISPTAGNINTLGTGSITIAGAGSTLTTQLTGLTNHSLLVGAGTATITNLGVATNGQLPIGSSAADPILATLTPGTGISITNGSGSITINSAGAGLTWTVVTGTTQAAAVNNGYIANNAGLVTVTLPSTSAVGDVVAVTGINNATGWKIAQNAGNTIFYGTSTTTAGVGGSLASTAIRDTVFLLCVTANAAWNVINNIGNLTVV